MLREITLMYTQLYRSFLCVRFSFLHTHSFSGVTECFREAVKTSSSDTLQAWCPVKKKISDTLSRPLTAMNSDTSSLLSVTVGRKQSWERKLFKSYLNLIWQNVLKDVRSVLSPKHVWQLLLICSFLFVSDWHDSWYFRKPVSSIFICLFVFCCFFVFFWIIF